MAASTESEKQRLAKVAQLMTLLEELREKETALLKEMQTLAAGGISIGQQMKQATDRFVQLWGLRYVGDKYAWEGARSAVPLKRLLLELGPAEVDRRMVNYIENGDTFFVQRRHPFAVFISTINQHAGGEGELDLLPPVADCKHQPRCQSDQEHTQRRSTDMRNVR